MRFGTITLALLIALWATCAQGQPTPTGPSTGAAGTEPDSGDPQKQYELAKNAFYYQDYDRTIALLTPLLTPEVRLPSKEQLQHAREMLGASLWWKKNPAAFREQFTRLLQDDARFELDAFYYPPEMVRDFGELKTQLEQAGLIKVPVDTTRKPAKVETYLYQHTPFGLTLLPFGVGQFANGQEGAGVLFLSLESSFLLANLSSWIYLYAANPHGTEREVGLWTMYGSLGLLTGTAIWGIIDAVVHHQSERLLRKETNDPEATLPETPPDASNSPGGFSLGLGWIGWVIPF